MTRTLLVVAALAGIAACTQERGPEVAFLTSTAHGQREVKYFEARSRELGLRTLTLASDNDSAKQLVQVEDALKRGAEVLVIQPAAGAQASTYVRLAHAKGAKVIAYDRAIAAPDLDYYVAHDSYRVGVLQAQAALLATRTRAGEPRKFVILSGPAGHSSAAEITRGYQDTLAPYIARGEVEIVVEQSHAAWSAELAQRTVEDALARSGKLDAILANNSSLARGAVHAVGAADHVFIAGADADAENINFVCQGKQAIEVLKDTQPLAKTAAEVAKQLISLQPSQIGSSSIAFGGKSVPVAAVRVELVTADNVKALVVDSGFLSVDELPACKNRLAAVR